jgi:hypothetical protein
MVLLLSSSICAERLAAGKKNQDSIPAACRTLSNSTGHLHLNIDSWKLVCSVLGCLVIMLTKGTYHGTSSL